MDECNLSRHLQRAVILFLCFQEGRFEGFNIDKPVPDNDTDYGQPNIDYDPIFNAWDHDRLFDQSVKTRHIVTDGNKILTRLCTK